MAGTRKGRNGGTLLDVPKGGPSPNPAGKPKGALSRKTIARRFLELEQDATNPITGVSEKLTQAELVFLAQLRKARAGDAAAYDRVMDAMFGKIPDRVEVAPSEGFPMEEMTDEELEQLANQQTKP